MDFTLSEDQIAVQELARKIFVERATDERIKKLSADPEWYDGDLWRDLADASLLGVPIPEEFGGMGFGLVELCLLLEEMGRCIAPVPLVPTLALGALPIAELGTAEQKKALLPGVATGKSILTAALSEIGSNDVSRPRTSARRSGSGFELSGEKVCVPAASRAARMLVPARVDGEVGIFLIAPDQAGVDLERERTTSGEPQFTLRLTGARAGEGDLLGGKLDKGEQARWIEQRAMVSLCSVQLGIAAAALERTAAYASTRKQFEQPIGSFQAVAMRSADAFIDVEAIRSALVQAVWRLSANVPAARSVEVAKWWACRAGHRVAHAAQHLHGGIGADLEYPIHRYFLWAKQTEYALGGATAHLARLGAMLARGEA